MGEVSFAAVGVVLAGGASRRFGRDKAREPYGETTLAGWAALRLQEVVGEVLVADRGRGLLAGFPSITDLASAKDRSFTASPAADQLAGPRVAPGGVPRSPAAGLLGAAQARPGRPLLVLACDLPSVPPELLRHLLRCFLEGNAAGESLHAVVPRHRRGVEPLCALYAPAALDLLGDRVARGELALHSWVEALGSRVSWMGEEEIAPFGAAEEVFRNVNRPADLPPDRSPR